MQAIGAAVSSCMQLEYMDVSSGMQLEYMDVRGDKKEPRSEIHRVVAWQETKVRKREQRWSIGVVHKKLI